MAPFWPDAMQELLLTAALEPAPAAIPAWQQWRAQVDFQALDAGSRRLIPLLNANLGRCGVDAATLAPLKDIQRQTWVKHQALLHGFAPVLSALSAAGIETILLKGLPLALGYYPHPSARPIADVDVMIRQRDWQRASRILSDAGWIGESALVADPVSSGIHSMSFRNGRGCEIDLHHSPFHECLTPARIEALWDHSVPLAAQGLSSRALCRADQLLHALVHGLRINPVPPIRWVADAVIIIRHAPDFDWPHLLRQARLLRLVRPVRAGLAYLDRRFPGLVPADVLSSLAAGRPDLLERLEWFSRSADGFVGPITRLGMFVRLNEGRSLGGKLARVPSFLRGIFKTADLPSTAATLAFRSLRAAWRLSRARLRKIIPSA